MQVGFILSLVFAILIAIFALQNSSQVMIDFIFKKIQISQAIVILVSASLGAVIATALNLVRQFKLNLKIKDLKRKITSLEEAKTKIEKKLTKYLEQQEELTNGDNMANNSGKNDDTRDENKKVKSPNIHSN
ncbi:LapA family protein [Thermohalobacter berrensis]|uniref:Lipopolysaccharide assembly protein A domain-containing protein n=1 Tax=Thermohalobacter berrensis TaxID=99594 RepID=A0A419TB12_9FIRM|nr:LapA family protein [Thermohalobacter berrensis]RKD34651.1 hypothetical protein BET03_02150 [Thermohalobacter berrensis]